VILIFYALIFYFSDYKLTQDGDVLGSCTMWEHLDWVGIS
jgi:hypothetical protein